MIAPPKSVLIPAARSSSVSSGPKGETATLLLSATDTARIEEIARIAREGTDADLVALLAEPSWAVRRAVVAHLACRGSAVNLLCAVIVGDRASEARLAAAVEALSGSTAASAGGAGQMGNAADEAVLGLIREGQPTPVLCDAAQILGRRKCAHAVVKLAGLVGSEDANLAAAAIEALGRIGGAGTVGPLIVAIERRDFFRTFPAILPLGRSADPRAIAPLVALLSMPLYAAEAALALGHSAHLTAVAPLVVLLLHTDDAVVRAAAGALSRLRTHHDARFDQAFRNASARETFGPTARRRLRGCIKGGRAAERIALATVLGWLEDDTAIAELVDQFRTETGDVEALSTALSALGVRAEPLLLQALRDGDSAERLRLMAIVKPRRAALSVLLACLDDADARVRAHACQALASIGDVSAVPTLFRHIGDPDAQVSLASVAAIHSLGCIETKGLAMDAALSRDPRRRRAALRIIAYFGFPEGLDAIEEAMADPDERIRDAAIYGLPFIAHPRAFALLLLVSESPIPRARAAAMRALGQTTDQDRAPEALRRGLRDLDPWVRYYACQALGRLTTIAALDEVIALIDDPAGQVRVAAIEAIAKLGGARATSVLDTACRSGDPDIRRVAILGLGGCDGADALPILLREVRSDDSATRLYALSALSEGTSDEATEALAHATHDSAEIVRNAAISLLSTRSGARATRWLVAQLADNDGDALMALQNPVAGRVEELLVALHTAEPPLTPLLISALARMGSPEAQAAIEAAFSLDNVHARRSAALALTALDSPAARPLLDHARLSDPDDEVRRICAASFR